MLRQRDLHLIAVCFLCTTAVPQLATGQQVAAAASAGNTFPVKGPFFVCDPRVIEDRWGVERFVVELRRDPQGPLLTAEHPWEGHGPYAGTTLYDPQDRLFKMWYVVFDEHAYNHKLPFSYNVCFAESNDGLEWRKPQLQLFDYRGSRQNNLVQLGQVKSQQIDVEFNPQSTTASDRFVAVHNDVGGLFISTSADGKAFQVDTEHPAIQYHSDTHNNFVYDEVRQRWLMYVRPQAYAAAGLPNAGRRRVAVCESIDFRNWTRERTVLVPAENDPDHFYGLTVFRRGDLFFGVLQLYETRTHHIDNELVWSTDGYHWDRLPVRDAARFLYHGSPGTWDAGMVLVGDRPLEIGQELWFYYGGTNVPHDAFDQAAIGLARTKRDRLIGVRSRPNQTGRLLSQPFAAAGTLQVNASVRGALRISVHTERDEPIIGWTAEDCSPIHGDVLDAPIRWGDRDLAQLAGQVIRLRFHLEDAELFAFDLL